jgi:uncharacterized protein YbjT (DUF2867 family)
MKKSAILFGSTGLVGSLLAQALLMDESYHRVTIVTRKPLKFNHPKLQVIKCDFTQLSEYKTQLLGTDVYIALGTTREKTPKLDEYYQIDHDYPVLAAQLCKEMGAERIAVVSAVGASASSLVFYLKTKGEMERDIIALNYNQCYIFRPSLILGKRNDRRVTERLFQQVFPLINPLLFGGLHIYKGISAMALAKAMINACRDSSLPSGIFHWNEIKKLQNTTH